MKSIKEFLMPEELPFPERRTGKDRRDDHRCPSPDCQGWTDKALAAVTRTLERVSVRLTLVNIVGGLNIVLMAGVAAFLAAIYLQVPKFYNAIHSLTEQTNAKFREINRNIQDIERTINMLENEHAHSRQNPTN